jgi:hypothetical protein
MSFSFWWCWEVNPGPDTHQASILPPGLCPSPSVFETRSHCYLCPGWPQTHSPPDSAHGVAGITGVYHHEHHSNWLRRIYQSLVCKQRTKAGVPSSPGHGWAQSWALNVWSGVVCVCIEQHAWLLQGTFGRANELHLTGCTPAVLPDKRKQNW